MPINDVYCGGGRISLQVGGRRAWRGIEMGGRLIGKNRWGLVRMHIRMLRLSRGNRLLRGDMVIINSTPRGI